MDPTGGRDARYNLNYSMSIGLSMNEGPEMYGNPSLGGRPPGGGGGANSLIPVMNRGGGGGLMSSGVQQTQCGGNGGGILSNSRGIKRTSSDCFDDRGIGSQGLSALESCAAGGVPDVSDDGYTSLQKKSPPANGKKTKGRVKIKMEYIDNKLRRYTTFSKRKTGIMKKAYELSTLTGTQVMLLVASETGHVYTFATRKLQPMITSEAGKQLIQTCLNSPDPPSGAATGDQRMSATGFEETELSYNIADEDSKEDRSPLSSGESGDESSGGESPGPSTTIALSSSTNPVSQNNSNHIQINSNASASDSIVRHNNNNTILHSDESRPNLNSVNNINNSSSRSSNCGGTGGGGTIGGVGGSSNNSSSSSSSILYPAAALANLPQEVLLGLVQAGHLQVHQEGDGSHQYITIPLSMMPSGLSGKIQISSKDTQSTAHGNGRETSLSPSISTNDIIIKKESID